MAVSEEIETQLDARSAHLSRAYDAERFAETAARAAELLRHHLDRATAGTTRVSPGLSPEETLSQWPDPAHPREDDPADVMAQFINGATHQHHPGFVGQQLSVVPPVAAPAAMISSLLNNSAAIFEGAPVAIALERRVVEWLLRTIGYGPEAGGVLTSGGTLGALTALLAMRQAQMPGDAWRDGVAHTQPVGVLMSREAHYCNRRACAILGFGERAVIPVDVDHRFAMTGDSLSTAYATAREKGLNPIAVIANAGATATGSHDELRLAASFCERHRLWLHVDAAHGGAALLSSKYRTLLDGVHLADSVVWDAHKMMLAPSNCTGVFFKQRAHLDAAFRQDAAYLLAGDEAPWYEPARRNFETTKPTFVLPWYLALRTLGVPFIGEHVEYAYDLARAFADEIATRPSFELLMRPESNIVCFRLSRATSDDDLQLRVRDGVNRRGRFFIMRTRLRGAIWLRVVLMNPLTRLEHLRDLLDELQAEAGT